MTDYETLVELFDRAQIDYIEDATDEVIWLLMPKTDYMFEFNLQEKLLRFRPNEESEI